MSEGWHYDELRQVGVDFEDVEQVARYDAKQGSSREAERGLVRRLDIGSGQVVVDLGCGTGSFAREAARGGARVRAVDVSQAMLDFVRREADREGLSSLETERAGFLTFAAAPDSIDVVVSRYALHHLPDFWKQVALLRLATALRPGGRLLLRDVVFSFEPETYPTAIESWVDRMPRESGFSRQEFETHVREEFSTFAWVLEGFLARAGFDILESDRPSPEYAEYLCTPAPAGR
ncbi:MAG: class I SAM-dependent methyltransferase [Myxococcota bacterium]